MEQASNRPGKHGNYPPVSGQWKPGQTGNPEGGRLHKRYKVAIELAMAKLAPNGDPMHTEVEMAGAQVARAKEGDTGAYRELMDRLYGKVPQAIVGDDEHGPVQLSVTWRSEAE